MERNLLKRLSHRLTAAFGKGYNTSSLRRMRRFYLAFPNGSALTSGTSIEKRAALRPISDGVLPTQAMLGNGESSTRLFPPLLSWTHYRILLKVHDTRARAFYEIEAANEAWSSRELERQIGSMHLVFYNRLLRCFVLIDLKLGKLTHQDLGQMQMYVNYFDCFKRQDDEAPTIGIILCSEKNDTMVRITLPEDNDQIYASRYQLYLPTEEELSREVARQRERIEQVRRLSRNDEGDKDD